MRYLLPIALGFAATLTGCGSSTRSFGSIAEEVQQDVPADWHVATSNNTIQISSFQRLRRRIDWAHISFGIHFGGGVGEIFGTKYGMTLTFVPLMTTNEYLRLKTARAPFLKQLDGVKGDGRVDAKTLYGDAMRGYATNRVPTFFTKDYSIYVDRPVDRFVETYPSNALVQAEAMLSRFKRLFKLYED